MSESGASTGTVAGRAKPSPLRGLVPMVHVASVERSVAFYRLLGFEVGNSVPREGTMNWAWLYCPGALGWKAGPNLMLARSGRAMNPGAQDVLFYLYAKDLDALREELIQQGVTVGEIKYPFYLPAGEFRMEDPDGYCLMLAQAGPETP